MGHVRRAFGISGLVQLVLGNRSLKIKRVRERDTERQTQRETETDRQRDRHRPVSYTHLTLPTRSTV